MHFLRILLAIALGPGAILAEQPLTTPRGAANAVTMQSGGAVVAQGGILAVLGEQLAAAHTKPDGTPLPLTLEDPAVEVLINGVAAPIFFVSPTQINVQGPWDADPGWAEVVVRRGDLESAALSVLVSESNPNLFTVEGSNALITQAVKDDEDEPSLGIDGTAPAAETGSAGTVDKGQSLAIFAVGLGQTDPIVENGNLGAGATPVAPQRAYIGGLPVEITSAELSGDTVGVFRLEVKVPDLASLGEVFRWYSGNSGSAAVLGEGGPPTPKYMSVSAELESPSRIDLSDLNPYFVAVSGPVHDLSFCYPQVQLLDFRRDSSATLDHCVLPSFPNAPNENAYRPFERSLNSSALVALAEPSEDPGDGITNRILVIDTAAGIDTESGSVAQLVELAQPADRLQQAFGNSRAMRLLQPGEEGEGSVYSLVDTDGTELGEVNGVTALPNPLDVDGLTVPVAQSTGFGNGYRMRFLGPDPAADVARPSAVLFDRDASVIAKLAFPDGWDPIAPPRRINNQGIPQGNSMAATQNGFRGSSAAYVLARASDGTGDAVVAFHADLPEDREGPAPDSVTLAATVTEFPAGVYAATCHTQVRWQRIALTSTLAVVANSQKLNEFAAPQQNQICAGDQLVLFDTVTSGIRSVSAPQPLDNAGKGVLGSYLYFADGAREVALQATQKIHIFDGVSETFSSVEFDEDVGILFNNFNSMQRLPGQARLVALATGGPTRTNPRGNTQAPLAGNRGLLVIDLPNAAAAHLALPDGFARVVALPNQLVVQQGVRTFGMFPLIGRAFAYAQKANAGPGNPGGTGILTWDVASAEATEMPLPEDGFAVVRRAGGGGGGGGGGRGGGGGGAAAARPYIWNWQPKSSSIAYGVYNRGGDLIAIGVLGPN